MLRQEAGTEAFTHAMNVNCVLGAGIQQRTRHGAASQPRGDTVMMQDSLPGQVQGIRAAGLGTSPPLPSATVITLLRGCRQEAMTRTQLQSTAAPPQSPLVRRPRALASCSCQEGLMGRVAQWAQHGCPAGLCFYH